MTLTSRTVARLLRLPAARTYQVALERDLSVPMRDGVVLRADRYHPAGQGSPPTILVRCPYGRRGLWGMLYGRLYAERGFNAVVQSTRGTFGSGGTFTPFLEREDGLDTVAWIERQPWFSGALATTGASYLGFTQWALAADAGPALKAVAIQVSSTEFHGPTYPGGAYALGNTLAWTHIIANQEKRGAPARMALAARTLPPVFHQLPLGKLDSLATGATVAYWQEWMDHVEPDDPYWIERAHDTTVGQVDVPVRMTTGWYDIFLPWQVADFVALRAAGRSPTITIGPWFHGSGELLAQGFRDTLDHFRVHLLGDPAAGRELPVRLFVTGAGEWRDYPDWPPPAAAATRWYLQAATALSTDASMPSEPDRYRYDPTDPTPAVAGPRLGRRGSEPTDNRALEARPDVLTYTSTPLSGTVEVIGPVSAELYVRSTLEFTDVFVRLCDVYPDGRSMNVCDGLLRIRPGVGETRPDGSLRITVEMWPVAHRFAAGNRLRVQVSSGAHPRYARNPGTGEPLGTASALLPADQTVYHDPDHPSAIILPVLTDRDAT
jgi:uncharacterized protein